MLFTKELEPWQSKEYILIKIVVRDKQTAAYFRVSLDTKKETIWSQQTKQPATLSKIDVYAFWKALSREN